MKIDRRRPAHWLYLAAFGLNVLLARLASPFLATRRDSVVLYGHKLGGNLLAIYRRLRDSGVDVVFLTMDPPYHGELVAAGERSCLALSPACIGRLARCGSVLSDHGLHALQGLLGRRGVRFFDTWHGIPFKGFDAGDFRVQHRFDETWVASPLMRELYVTRFGFDPDRVRVTGYARTDVLVRAGTDRAAALQRCGLAADAAMRTVLFAPTWKQDSRERSVYPFGVPEDEFLDRLAQRCAAAGAVLLLRTHLNSGSAAPKARANVRYLPYAGFPDTESVLLASDVLICDWSSIAFDYLLLDRPTIFLDVPPPFGKGFSLGPEFRHGAVVDSLDALLRRTDEYLRDPARYQSEFGERSRALRDTIYGACADGRATERCIARLDLPTR